MQIILNGQPHDCAAGSTLAALLAATGHAQRRVAVEVNRAIVPRGQHAQRMLAEGDHVEIIHAVGGG